MSNHIQNFNFFTAGNATFTVTNPQGVHYTFKISRPRNAEPTCPLFVSLLSGADNVSDYTYVGILTDAGAVKLTRKSRLLESSLPVKVIRWALNEIKAGRQLPKGYTCQHEGKCCRCGRMLTTPESIDSGIGPECASKVGAHWGRAQHAAPATQDPTPATNPTQAGDWDNSAEERMAEEERAEARPAKPTIAEIKRNAGGMAVLADDLPQDEYDLYATHLPGELDGEEKAEMRYRDAHPIPVTPDAPYQRLF